MDGQEDAVVGESWWTHNRGVISDFRSENRFSELREGGKVAAGAGFGGVLGWIATMASVTGSGAHYKVWTTWSVLLVALSMAVFLGGMFCWRFFRPRRAAPPTVIYDQRGATITYNAEPPHTGVASASTTDTMTVSTVFRRDPIQDRHRSALSRISNLITEGQRLSWAPIERQERDHGPWQERSSTFSTTRLRIQCPHSWSFRWEVPRRGNHSGPDLERDSRAILTN